MEKILVIAGREFRAAVLNKAFLVSLILMPVLILISSNASRFAQGWKSQKSRSIAIIDRTPGVGVEAVATLRLLRDRELAQGAQAEKNRSETTENGGLPTGQLALLEFESIKPPTEPTDALKLRYDLGRRVASGELAAFFDIGPAALETNPQPTGEASVTYYTDKALDRDILLGVGVKLMTIVQLQRTATQNPLLLMRLQQVQLCQQIP